MVGTPALYLLNPRLVMSCRYQPSCLSLDSSEQWSNNSKYITDFFRNLSNLPFEFDTTICAVLEEIRNERKEEHTDARISILVRLLLRKENDKKS